MNEWMKKLIIMSKMSKWINEWMNIMSKWMNEWMSKRMNKIKKVVGVQTSVIILKPFLNNE